ncbi:MAG: ATP-binding cassette domain-containing protein [Gemmatimonadetes bacterium]|nr:ATP-binding cassette domain-containing protein [Gemmatimonadota bacterium]
MAAPDHFTLRRVLRAHPRRTAGVTVLMTLAGAAEGIGFLTLLPVLESVAPGGHPTRVGRAVTAALGLIGVRPSLGALFALVALALFAKAAFRWAAMAQVGSSVAAVAAELRLRLLRALLSARWSHFAGQPLGRAAGGLSRDAFWAAFAYRDACAALAAAIQLVVYAVAGVLVSGRLGVLALAAGLAASAPLGLWVRVSRDAGTLQTRHSLALTTRVVDVLQAIKPIRAMGREGAYLEGLAAETEALREAERRHVRATEALRALQEPLLAVLVLGVLFAALAWGRVDLPTLLVQAVLFQRMVGRFHVVQSEYQAMAAASSAYASLEAQIEEAERDRESGGGAPAPALVEGIELDRVCFRHRGRPVLEEVALAVPAGAFVAIVGPSGAGKTTLMDLLAGLREPDSGEVRVDGVPLATVDPAAWRRRLGYVPQESILLHETVLDNVILREPGLGARDAARALAQAGAGELIASLPDGLETLVGERGLRLSGGERRRLALARALVGQPRLLLLDEATAELDPVSAAEVGRTLRTLRGRLTIVAVTHHSEIAAAADAVYTLADGRLTTQRLPEAVPT